MLLLLYYLLNELIKKHLKTWQQSTNRTIKETDQTERPQSYFYILILKKKGESKTTLEHFWNVLLRISLSSFKSLLWFVFIFYSHNFSAILVSKQVATQE